jgi:hypothetical protein
MPESRAMLDFSINISYDIKYRVGRDSEENE